MTGASATRRAAALGVLLLAGCGGGEAPVATAEYAAQGAFTAALSSRARHALLGSIQQGVSLWDVARGERLYRWSHQPGVASSLIASAFSSAGRYALTAAPRDLVLWEVDSGQAVGYWGAPAEILAAALGPNGSFALLGLGDRRAVYVDIRQGGILQTLSHDGRVEAIALGEDGTLALTGSDDRSARLWDLQSGRLLSRHLHGNAVNTVALSPNGRYAFSASQLDRAQIWETATGRVVQTLSGGEGWIQKRISYTAAVFSSTSDQLLTGTSAGLVQLWDVRAGRELKRWRAARRDPLRPTGAYIYALGFDSGAYYALASNGLMNRFR